MASDVQTYYIPPAERAMGIPKKHLYRDCQHLRNSVVREMPADNPAHLCLRLCGTCAKRYQREEAARHDDGR